MALKADSDQSIDEKDLMNAIWDMVYQLFGEFGASQTALFLVKRDNEKGIVIIRCSHKALNMVRAAITAVTDINRKRAVIRVVAVSGTLKALRRKLFEH